MVIFGHPHSDIDSDDQMSPINERASGWEISAPVYSLSSSNPIDPPRAIEPYGGGMALQWQQDSY